MASSASKWIFQTAVLLCFLIMMTEGYKCYQCAAADYSCKTGKPEHLKECDCKTKVLVPQLDPEAKGGTITVYSNDGCSSDSDTKTWVGCQGLHGEGSDEKNKVKVSILGCSLEKKTGCETKSDKQIGASYKVTVCHCDIEGCNIKAAGQKLSPKSSTLLLVIVVPAIILGGILQKIIYFD